MSMPSSREAVATSALNSPDFKRRSEEHTSELQSQSNLVCRLLLEKKKKIENEYRSNPLVIINVIFLYCLIRSMNQDFAFSKRRLSNLLTSLFLQLCVFKLQIICSI